MVWHGVARGTLGVLFWGQLRDSTEWDMIWHSCKASVAYLASHRIGSCSN